MKASQPEEWKPIEAVTRVETHDDANPRFKRDSHRWKRDANNTVVYKGSYFPSWPLHHDRTIMTIPSRNLRTPPLTIIQ